MTTTTLKAIQKELPYDYTEASLLFHWGKLLKHLGKTKADDEPLEMETILNINGISDAIWCLRALPDEYESVVRLFNCDMAEHVLHIFENKYPKDKRPRESIRMSRAYSAGESTFDELNAAAVAAFNSLDYSRLTAGAAWGAAWASAVAARISSRTSAFDVSDASATSAYRNSSLGDAMREEEYQTQLFLQYFGKDKP